VIRRQIPSRSMQSESELVWDERNVVSAHRPLSELSSDLKQIPYLYGMGVIMNCARSWRTGEVDSETRTLNCKGSEKAAVPFLYFKFQKRKRDVFESTLDKSVTTFTVFATLGIR